MYYQFRFRPYQRRFKPPLETSHGSWEVREGIIVRLSDQRGTSCGEIAPISWFGSETMEQALDFCRQLSPEITDKTIFSIPNTLPACQFGFESAWEGLGKQEDEKTCYLDLTYSALLPAGEDALNQWQTLWEKGDRTFKWKIGVSPMPEEIEIFRFLMQILPEGVKLRLDANGGLSYEDANYWLGTCDRLKGEEISGEIEFIEQPLAVDQFKQMQELSNCYSTAIALDESVATLTQLKTCEQQGWRGVFVIKPGIIGSPSQLREFCRNHQIDAVFSSVFETSIGRCAALKLASELSPKNRSVGFGINHWFEDDETWLEDLCK